MRQALPAWAFALLLGLVLKPLFAWRMLRDEVLAVEAALGESLESGPDAARARLVSRDVSQLGEREVRESAIESLAENLERFAGGAGVLVPAARPAGRGALPLRQHGRCDVGLPRRARRARLDLGRQMGRARRRPYCRGCPRGSRCCCWRWRPGAGRAGLRARRARTPSPNSGWPMAAMALLLGVRLAKPACLCAQRRGPGRNARRHRARGPFLASAPRCCWRWPPGCRSFCCSWWFDERARFHPDPRRPGCARRARDDFSTNANACGPCPEALAAGARGRCDALSRSGLHGLAHARLAASAWRGARAHRDRGRRERVHPSHHRPAVAREDRGAHGEVVAAGPPPMATTRPPRAPGACRWCARRGGTRLGARVVLRSVARRKGQAQPGLGRVDRRAARGTYPACVDLRLRTVAARRPNSRWCPRRASTGSGRCGRPTRRWA